MSETTLGDSSTPIDGGRASLDLQCQWALDGGWTATLSNRFDDFWARGSAAQTLDTLKEAYLTWREGPDQLFDIGRINVREGVGLAYNPTDYFRAGALRTVLSPDPGTLRTERLGTVMARSQTLWSSGSLTAIYAPRISAHPSESTFNPDFGASNSGGRWLLILSQRLSADFQPQLLITQASHQSAQAGLDLSWILGTAAVAHLEWSGGRSPGNLELSGIAVVPTTTAFRSRLSTGLTYTTPSNLSMGLEYEYDGAAPDDREWGALRSMSGSFVRYRDYVADQQELATRQNVFALAQWADTGRLRLELTVLVRFDPYDHSHLVWGEARYAWRHADVALQWQRSDGAALSDFSLWPARQSWLVLVDYYL